MEAQLINQPSCIVAIADFIDEVDRIHSSSPITIRHPFWDRVLFTIQDCPRGEACIVAYKHLAVFTGGALLFLAAIILLRLFA